MRFDPAEIGSRSDPAARGHLL